MPRCKLACILPSSSLDPRLASGAFAVAEDEGCDRFIGDRRPLNSRERSIGRAHLPYCTRLRRTILGKPETVQITIRDSKDCFYLFEARVAKQVISPRNPRSWLEHLNHETRIWLLLMKWNVRFDVSELRAQRRLETYTLMALSFSVFSNVRVEPSPIEVQRADA